MTCYHTVSTVANTYPEDALTDINKLHENAKILLTELFLFFFHLCLLRHEYKTIRTVI